LAAFAIQKDSAAQKRVGRKTSSKQQTVKADTVLIVNPNACSGLTGKNWDQLYDQIKRVLGKTNIEVVLSKKAGDGTRLARDYLRRGFTEIYAIGGDGTINEIANGFFEENTGIRNRVSKTNASRLKPINTNAKLAVVPCGTRNVLVKSLNLPGGVVECCKQIASVRNKPVKLDVIGVQATNKEDGSKTPLRIMLNAAEMGVAAEIIGRSKKVRNVVKSRLVSTVAAVISTLPSYESNLCTISLDNNFRKTFDTNMTMGVVANGKFLGGGFIAAPNADMSDGLLDVVILKDSGSFKMLDELVNLKSGEHFDVDNMMYAQAKKVSIKSKERDVAVTLDGEPIGILPAVFHVFHNALNVIA
jgi:diacylglycerol kinase family enzyme